MKKIVLLTLIAISLGLFAQKKKKEIVYNKISDSLNTAYAKLVAYEIKDPSFKLFQGAFFIGPELYEMMIKDTFLLPNCINTTYIIDDLKLPGKVAQKEDDYFDVWNYFLKKIDVNSFKILKLNQEQIKRYWARINFNIDEPIMIVESKGNRWLIDIDEKGRLVWIDLI